MQRRRDGGRRICSSRAPTSTETFGPPWWSSTRCTAFHASSATRTAGSAITSSGVRRECSRRSADRGAVAGRMLSPRSQQALFTLPAFRGLGEAERKQAAGFFREIALEKDAVVYRAGDAADTLYLLVSGAVDVLHGDEIIARYGPGEVFGEAAVFAGERRAVTTRVALDAVLLVLPRDSIDRLLELHPLLHQRVSALIARRLKEAMQVATSGRRA